MRRDNLFIVLEGMDGSGKSTIVKMLVPQIGGIYYPTSSSYYRQIRVLVDNNADVTEHFLFYLAAVRYASEEIRKLLPGHIVVCDRYIYTTLAYHRALGCDIRIDIAKLNLLEPDYTFYLQVSPETQLRRLEQKPDKTFADDWIIKQDIFERLDKEFKQFPVIIIDTEQKQPQEIVNEIISIIKKGCYKC